MATVKELRGLIRHCCEVNCNYMRLPAGQLERYPNLIDLYQRIADQSLECANAWVRNLTCPDHEPAVDAFWWAVSAWAETFGLSAGMPTQEWFTIFVYPHIEFARYLKPEGSVDAIDPHAGKPAETILELDVRWMKRVMILTGAWGWFVHLKDVPAVEDARCLERELRSEDSEARDAYLHSDLIFFHELFKPFPFKEKTREQLMDWLDMAEPDQSNHGNGKE